MKSKRYMKALVIMVVIGICFGTFQATANVSDNLGDADAIILGKVDDTVIGSFSNSTTNAKLNTVKTQMDSLSSTVHEMVKPYIGSLSLWVNSSNRDYVSKSITITDEKGNKQRSKFYANNGHYEASFPSLLRGKYTIDYPFILSSGKVINLTSVVDLAGNVTKELYGDLMQMSIKDIQLACKAGSINAIANVGDTFTDGTYTYTIIGIDQDTPSDENGNPLPKSSYGNVLTVMPLGAPVGKSNGSPVKFNLGETPYQYNQAETSANWKNSPMRTSTMQDYLAKLPEETQSVIGYVKKDTGRVTYVSTNYINSVDEITGDKCFLLSAREIDNLSKDLLEEYNATFQYQYFAQIATKAKDRYLADAWLRSPFTSNGCYYMDTLNMQMGRSGIAGSGYDPDSGYGYAYPAKKNVLPAFCIY